MIGGVAEETRAHEVDYAKPFTEEQVRTGRHRERAGGLWDELGRLQLDFMLSQGLEPSSRLLDVGCGPLRAGIRFVDYLEPGNYYGVDVNASLLDAGYEVELPDRLREKLPRDHLRATDRFDCDFGVEFDFAIAQSLFTHISLSHVRLCLYRIAARMRPDGRLFATFFEAPAQFSLDGVLDGHHPRRKDKFTERNPFWYWPGDLEWAASFAPWEFRYIGDWNHPRNQKMAEFRRRAD
jgi:SAM-dependent methyltransferase